MLERRCVVGWLIWWHADPHREYCERRGDQSMLLLRRRRECFAAAVQQVVLCCCASTVAPFRYTATGNDRGSRFGASSASARPTHKMIATIE